MNNIIKAFIKRITILSMCTCVSHWILTSCQPHRVTSRQQIHTSDSSLFSYANPFSSQPQNQSLHKCLKKQNKTKHTYTNIKHKFSKLVSSILPTFKKHIRPGHAGIVTIPSNLLLPDLKIIFFKDCSETNKQKSYITASWQIPVPCIYGSKLHIPPYNHHRKSHTKYCHFQLLTNTFFFFCFCCCCC